MAPLESPALADFVAALDEVNAGAEGWPGFRWRLVGDEGPSGDRFPFTHR